MLLTGKRNRIGKNKEKMGTEIGHLDRLTRTCLSDLQALSLLKLLFGTCMPALGSRQRKYPAHVFCLNSRELNEIMCVWVGGE